MTILITNDDGYKSWGLNILYKAAKKVFGDDIMVVAPDKYQSATGMSFTFHKPLRIEELEYEKMPCFAVSGTPADCVFMSLHHLFKHKVTLVLSGVNNGMNAGLDTVYSSGTVSAAMCAAIYKIPSVAFSKDLDDQTTNVGSEEDMSTVYDKLVFILTKIKDQGFPEGVELLNVNFPKEVNDATKIKVVNTDKNVFEESVQTNKDPRGREYYWLYGSLKKNLKKDADVATLLGGNITITPMDISASDDAKIDSIKQMFSE